MNNNLEIPIRWHAEAYTMQMDGEQSIMMDSGWVGKSGRPH